MSVMLHSSYISHRPLTFCGLTGFDPPQSRPWELKTARTTVHLVTLRMPRDQWLFLFRDRIITDVESKFGSQVSFSVPHWCTWAPLLLPSLDRRSHGRCDTGQLSVKEWRSFCQALSSLAFVLHYCPGSWHTSALHHAVTCSLSTDNNMQLSRQFVSLSFCGR